MPSPTAPRRAAASRALADHQRWTVQTPAADPLLRTDLYLCGDVVHWVSTGWLGLSPHARSELHLRHSARLADLDTDWDRLERWLDALEALQPYALGLSIVWTTSLAGHAAMASGTPVRVWLAATWPWWLGQLTGLVGSMVGVAARTLLGWWLRRRMRRALAEVRGQVGVAELLALG